ncbi:MAG: hypothetical protein LBN33_03610 [Desulfovibrio sp.]|jgi:hypothetical protein|nr:hypothetical protein [Desulfovibrio sp.]
MKKFFNSILLLALFVCLAGGSSALAASPAPDEGKQSAAPAVASEKKAPVTVKPAAAKPAAKPVAAKPADESKAPAAKPAAAKPVAAKPADESKAPAAKPAAAKPAAKPAAKAAAEGKAPASSLDETLKRKLDEFAQKTIESINRHILPSERKKEVKKNGDGTFVARYIAVDPTSIATSFKKSDGGGPVQYIGYMSYTEKEYHCIAPSKAAAEKGPFTLRSSEGMTELVKYVNGRWTY